MEDEVSDDDLPSISVTSLSQDSSMREMVMPPAGALAAERAREQRTERELQRLRELHEGAARSDSSGSEGEAALARAVRALRVLPPGAPRPAAAPLARALLHSLPAADTPPLPALHAAISRTDPAALKRLTDRVIHALSCVTMCDSNSLSEEETVTSVGLACAVWLAAPSLRARRVLHAVCGRATHGAVRSLAAVCAGAARGSGPPPAAARALLQLSDAARGGPAAAGTLADLLVRHALAALLKTGPDYESGDSVDPPSWEALSSAVRSGGWRGLEAAARLTALRLGARLAAPLPAPHRTPLLDALAQPPPANHRHHPDYLKVAVAASTIQLLFREQPRN